MLKRILLPADGSAAAAKAAAVVLELAAALGAEVHALAVIEPLDLWSSVGDVSPPMATPEFYAAQHDQASVYLQKVYDAAMEAGVAYTEHIVHAPKTWRAVIELAQDLGIDLIVMGSRGHRGFASWILGNEAERVLTNTDVPVLIVRADDKRRFKIEKVTDETSS